MKFEDKTQQKEDCTAPPNVTHDLPNGWSWWSRHRSSEGNYKYLFGTDERFCYRGELECCENSDHYKFYIYKEEGISPDGKTITPEFPSIVESRDSQEEIEHRLQVVAKTKHNPD